MFFLLNNWSICSKFLPMEHHISVTLWPNFRLNWFHTSSFVSTLLKEVSVFTKMATVRDRARWQWVSQQRCVDITILYQVPNAQHLDPTINFERIIFVRCIARHLTFKCSQDLWYETYGAINFCGNTLFYTCFIGQVSKLIAHLYLRKFSPQK